VVRGNEDHARHGVFPAKSVEQLEAGEAGQVNIEQQHVVIFALKLFERFVAGFGSVEEFHVVPRTEDVRERGASQRVVVDDQYASGSPARWCDFLRHVRDLPY